MHDTQSQGQAGRPAVFFDRDGVVNITPGEGYVASWKEFRLTPGIDEGLALCRTRGFATVLVTNQRGVFTGATTAPALQEIHHQMQAQLGFHQAAFDAIYAATGDRDDPRRKPQPAMFLEAAAELGLDLSKSFMIGDHDNDIRAARAAGVGTTIRYVDTKPVGVDADYSVSGILELLALLDRLLVR